MILSTVLIDPPTTLFGGAILALISIALLKRNGLAEVWRVGRLSALWGFIYSLSVGWHFFNRTDWMFCYLMDTTQLPLAAIYAVFIFVCTAWAAIGGVAVASLIHLKQVPAAIAVALSAIIGFGLFLFMTLDQYTHVGTRAEYVAGRAVLAMEDASWKMASNVSAGIFGLAAVVIIVIQIRRARQAPAT